MGYQVQFAYLEAHVFCINLNAQEIWVCNQSVLSLRGSVGEIMAGREACARNHKPVQCFSLVLTPGPNP